MAKEIEFGSAARVRLMRGVDILTDAVAITLGPRGRNVILEKAYGPPQISKDGVTVAKSIELTDKFENAGAQLVKEVASKTNDTAGDGTTTATVLARAILKEGLKAVEAGLNPMDMQRGMHKALKAALLAINDVTTDVDSTKKIEDIGTVSANGDVEIGKMISKAMVEVGENGVITVETANTTVTELDIVDGLNFDKGYVSPYFATNEKMTAELDDPFVLIYNRKILNLQQLLPLLEKVVGSNRSLLIIAEDIDGEALAALVVNKLHGKLNNVAVKAPSFGDRRLEILHDIAIITNGTVISESTGSKLENVTLEDLGQAKKVIVTKDDTTIIDGAGTKDAIASRAAQVRMMIEETTSDYDKEKLEERLAKLSGGVAIIKVGGTTEVEVAEKKDRVVDAVNSTKAAAKEGIVAGGGVALLYASTVLDKKGLNHHLCVMSEPLENTDQEMGWKVIQKALLAPTMQIAQNAGEEGVIVVNKIVETNDWTGFGYNAKTREYGNLLDTGILDPKMVVRLALENAVSVASLVLTTGAVIADEPKKEDNSPSMPQ